MMKKAKKSNKKPKKKEAEKQEKREEIGEVESSEFSEENQGEPEFSQSSALTDIERTVPILERVKQRGREPVRDLEELDANQNQQTEGEERTEQPYRAARNIDYEANSREYEAVMQREMAQMGQVRISQPVSVIDMETIGRNFSPRVQELHAKSPLQEWREEEDIRDDYDDRVREPEKMDKNMDTRPFQPEKERKYKGRPI